MEKERTLTDADVEAISAALLARFKREFYLDLGKGFWGFIWRALIVAAMSIAAYGALKH